MNRDDQMPAVWHDALTKREDWLGKLNHALQARHEEGAFDRCSTGGEGCKQPVISAHAISRTALECIANQNNMVMATYKNPPTNAIAHYRTEMLSPQSINSFSTGRWACAEHDRIFTPIDSKNIDVNDQYNLFLIVYRVTVRLCHFAVRTAEPLATMILHPASKLLEVIPEEPLKGLQGSARIISRSAAHLCHIKWQMDKMLSTQTYDRLNYRVAYWNAEPTLAGAGIRWFTGDENKTLWSGTARDIPGWVVAVPQEHGQLLITACPYGGEKYTEELHRGMPKGNHQPESTGRNWTRLMSNKLASTAADLAISLKKYESLSQNEQKHLLSYIRTRSRPTSNTRGLPNLLNSL